MNEEVVQLEARFSRLGDEALLSILTTERAEYRRVALDLAAAELSRRGVPVPPAPPLERRLIERGVEFPGPGVLARRWIAGQWLTALFCLALLALPYIVNKLLNPGNSDLRTLIYFSCAVIYVVTAGAVLKKFYSASPEELLVVEYDETEAERLKAELRAVAEDARDMLGLEWEASDVYVDAYGYHIDFYDEAGRLRAAVFERPPGRGWDAEAVALRLHEMSLAPRSLSPVRVGGFSHYE